MDRNAILIIGIVDTLRYLLETDEAAKNSTEAVGAISKLDGIRADLLQQGLQYSQMMGAARDAVFDISFQLEGQLSNLKDVRNVQWIIHGLLSTDIQDVQPPLLPSSSNGPKSVSPEIMKVAEALMEMSRPSAEPTGINRIEKLAKSKSAKNGKIRKS